MEERERRLAARDSAIERSMADIHRGKVHESEDVFAELQAEITALPDPASV